MRSVKVNFIFSSLKGAMSVLFPVISFPYISRVLGVNKLGQVEYCQSIISYFALFAALGIALYAVREGAKFREDKEKLTQFCREIMTINLISTTVVYLALFIFMMLPAMRSYRTLLLVCSLTIILTTLSIEWLYQMMEDYMYISIRSVIVQALALAAMFLFVKTEDDYIMYALLYVLSTGGAFVFNLVHARKYINLFQKTEIHIKKHLKPIFIIFGIAIASSIYLNMDKVMLGAMKGDYSVGLYSAAVKINTIVKTLISSISLVVMPRLSSYLATGNNKQYKLLLKKGIDFNMVLSIPAAVGMMILSKELIVLFSGESYIAASASSVVLSANIFFSAIDGLFYYQILLPYGKEKEACIGTSLGAVLNTVLNFVLITVFDTVGAAIATIISEIVVFMYFIYVLKQLLDLKYLLKDINKIIIATLTFIPFVLVISTVVKSDLIKVIVSGVVAAVIYFVILLLLKFDLAKELLDDVKSLL